MFTTTVKIPDGVVNAPRPQRPARNVRGRKARPRKRGQAARYRKKQQAPRVRMPPRSFTKAGDNFLRCAFAPPDFNIDPGQGIPDNYDGKTLMRKDNLTQTLSFAPGSDTYIIVPPTPGQAYWSATIPYVGGVPVAPSSSTTFVPVSYPGAFGVNSLFGVGGGTGSGSRADNVDAFRYASTAFGIYPTSNLMQFGGSISVWKAATPQTLLGFAQTIATVPPTQVNATSVVVNGLDSVAAIPTDNYTHSFMDGCYTVATCNQPDFEFIPIMEGLSSLPQGGVSTSMYGQLNGDFLGMGAMDTLFIKVSTPAGVVNNAVIRTWACAEFRVTADSLVYQYASASPPLDTLALESYRAMGKSMPLAVPARENSTFWERMVRIMNSVTKAVSYIPGPIGAIGSGVGIVTDALSSLFM